MRTPDPLILDRISAEVIGDLQSLHGYLDTSGTISLEFLPIGPGGADGDEVESISELQGQGP